MRNRSISPWVRLILYYRSLFNKMSTLHPCKMNRPAAVNNTAVTVVREKTRKALFWLFNFYIVYVSLASFALFTPVYSWFPYVLFILLYQQCIFEASGCSFFHVILLLLSIKYPMQIQTDIYFCVYYSFSGFP